MSYWKKVFRYFKEKGTITTYEIQQMTNTTCPHGVIRALKNHGEEMTHEDCKANGKSYRKFIFVAFNPKKQKDYLPKTEINSSPDSSPEQIELDLKIQNRPTVAYQGGSYGI